MRKNIFAGVIVALVFVVGTSTLAPSASALTVGDIQAQIKELLAKISDLSKQLQELRAQQTPPTEPSPVPYKHRVCDLLNRNLSQGIQGEDVQSLQEFLKEEGYLSANPTGFFGPMTAGAVAKWQSSQGVQSVGFVGPMTRERIKIWCEGNQTLTAVPQRGSAPLTVTFTPRPRGYGIAEATYKITFGDGTSDVDYLGTPIQHTYTNNGAYTAQLLGRGYGTAEMVANFPWRTIGSVSIYVGPIACTMEYSPVCGAKPIVCITTPCNPVPTTYGNKCMMNADGASFLYAGECRTDPPICLAVEYQRPICAPGESVVPVDSTSPCPGPWKCVSSNKPPTISSFSGPTTLAVNQSGTWTIQASDPENGQLSYSVDWGDVAYLFDSASAPAMREAFEQTTTFTHSYSSAGTYQVAITVRDSAGKEAKTSSTVRVGNEPVACTMEYAPVCGRVPGCMNTCPSGMYCAMLCQQYPVQTYSNKCMLSAAGAELIRSGACAPNEI